MSQLKEKAKAIWLQALQAVDVTSRVQEKIRTDGEMLIFGTEIIELTQYDEIVLIGMGKASLEMGAAVEAILEPYKLKGLVVTNRRQSKPIKSEIIVAGHPLPNQASMEAARKIIQLLQTTTSNSLVIFLISGGGSALVEMPADGISLEELQEANHILVNCGATIGEINLIRKVISKIKGGNLKQYIKGKAFAIYLSDVKTDDLGSIASGPLIDAELSSWMMLQIIEKYDLFTRLPASITVHLRSQLSTEPNSSVIRTTIPHLLLMDNLSIVQAAADIARKEGIVVEECVEQIDGNYRDVAGLLLEKLQNVVERFPGKLVGLISGGEVTCLVKGRGIGGRNIEFALYSAIQAANFPLNVEVAILSSGSDGIDGSSCAAGAIASSNDFQIAFPKGLDESLFLANNDTHSFLQQTGGLLFSGPTGNNIRDLRIMLAYSK